MKPRLRLFYKFFGVCLFIFTFLFFGGVNVFGASKTAPDVSLETLQGKVTLSEHRGKTLVLFFSFPG